MRVIWCYKLGLLIGYFIKNRLRFSQILTVNISKFKAHWAVGEERAVEQSGVPKQLAVSFDFKLRVDLSLQLKILLGSQFVPPFLHSKLKRFEVNHTQELLNFSLL